MSVALQMRQFVGLFYSFKKNSTIKMTVLFRGWAC